VSWLFHTSLINFSSNSRASGIIEYREGLSPVELVSRSLHETKSKNVLSWGVWIGVGSLPRSSEKLTNGFDLGRIGTILPARAEGREDQAVSPDRVKTCGAHEKLVRRSRDYRETLRIQAVSPDCEKNSQVCVKVIGPDDNHTFVTLHGSENELKRGKCRETYDECAITFLVCMLQGCRARSLPVSLEP